MKEKQRVEERAESPLQLIKYNEIQWTQIENDGYDVVSSVYRFMYRNIEKGLMIMSLVL